MNIKKGLAASTVLVVSLALPGAAAAKDLSRGVSAVKAHTVKADRALDRAVARWERNVDGRAERSFAISRRELRRASADAARVTRRADTAAERRAAARSQRLVAEQRAENVEQLVEVVDELEGDAQAKVAGAVLTDTVGRDKALAVLSSLLEDGVPQSAQRGIAKAMSSLAQGRDEEIEAEGEALASGQLSNDAVAGIAEAIEANVEGQSRAAAQISALLDSESMPDASRAGLTRALEAIAGEQEQAASALSQLSERLPEEVRSFVESIVAQAQSNAQGLRDSRPSTPGGTEVVVPEGRP